MRAFSWFLGENDLGTTLIDPDTGSCSDGLHPDRPNENKGAESALSYLLAHVEISQLKGTAAMGKTKPLLKQNAAPFARSHLEQPQRSLFVSIPILEPPEFVSAPGARRAYRDGVLPPNVTARVSAEMSSALGGDRYVGTTGVKLGMNTFGSSAPLKDPLTKFGFTPTKVLAAAKDQSAKSNGKTT